MKHWIGSVILLVCAFLPLKAQGISPLPQRPPDTQNPEYRLAVDVELINVTATVLDESGKYVEGLQAQDFQIIENGQEQKISFFSHDRSVPISIGVLLDISSSMRHKLRQPLQIVREIASALSPDDEMFLITFNSEVDLRMKFTSNREEIQQSLRDIRLRGETALHDAITIGLQEMRSAKHQKKILLLMTDGFDTKSKIKAQEVEGMLKRSEVLVYAIGIDDDDGDTVVLRGPRYHIYHYLLERLTGVSGGRAFSLFSSRNYALQGLAAQLLEELHQQYTLSYYPAAGRAGTGWREVEVRVRKPAVQVRHRSGYYAHVETAQRR